MYLFITMDGAVHNDIPQGMRQMQFPFVVCSHCYVINMQYNSEVHDCKSCGSRDLVMCERVYVIPPQIIVAYAESCMGDTPMIWADVAAVEEQAMQWRVRVR